MKALVFSDVHADESGARCFNDRSRSLQSWRVARFFEQAYKIFQDHRCDCIWDLGDLTSDRSSIPIPAIDTVFNGLMKFPRHPWNLKLIGNHEMFFRSTQLNSGKMFKNLFQVVDCPTATILGDLAIALCPFPYDDAQLAAWIDAFHEDYHDHDRVILGHFQVIGSKMPSGLASTGIPKELMTEFKLGLLGHVHRAQELTPNVFYVGSPFQQDKGEAGEAKRVGVVDTDKLTVEWIAIEGFPQYVTYTFEQFKTLFTDHTEDRVEVILTSPEEAERFYAHPLSGRAEPVYRFNVQDQGELQEDHATPRGQNVRKDTILEYFKVNPPADSGITLSTEDLITVAEDLVSSAETDA